MSNALTCLTCNYHPDGTCHRHSPHPNHDMPAQLAQWNPTEDDQFCGKYKADKPLILCGQCIHWDHPENGVTPRSLRGKTPEWWAETGYCRDNAPGATTYQAAKRTYWPVTHRTDNSGCGNGVDVNTVTKNKEEMSCSTHR